MNFNGKTDVHITICFGNQLVFMDWINFIRKIHLIFNSIFFNNGDWTIHGEWNIDDTKAKIYSACSQNFYFSNDLFFYMTFMNPLNRNDFNVNVILLFSRINVDFSIHNLNPNMILKESKKHIFSNFNMCIFFFWPHNIYRVSD